MGVVIAFPKRSSRAHAFKRRRGVACDLGENGIDLDKVCPPLAAEREAREQAWIDAAVAAVSRFRAG